MKRQIIFIHGGQAFSDYGAYLQHLKATDIENPFDEKPEVKKWKYTLQDALGGEYEIAYPAMPCAGNAKYEEWKIWFERHFRFLHDGVILIGHSQGGYFLSKYLIENTMPMKIHSVFLVAAPFEPDGFGEEDGGDFYFDSQNIGNIAKQSKNVFIFHSKDDPIVSFAHARKYKAALPEAELVSFEDRGHFLGEELPEIVEYIKTS